MPRNKKTTKSHLYTRYQKTFLALDEIRKRISGELGILISLIENAQPKHYIGFFSLPRLIFPEIFSLARLRYGYISENGDSKCAARYIANYFGDSKMDNNTALNFITIYRHQLSHWTEPKGVYITKTSEDINWGITAPNLSLINFEFKKQTPASTSLIFHPKQWYEFILHSIDKYESDLSNEFRVKKTQDLLEKFEKGYKELKSKQIK